MNVVINSPKSPSETSLLTFDFISSLAISETINSASCTVSVYTGVDASPSSLLSGSASVSGTKVTQKITSGNTGTIYKIVCIAVTSSSQTLGLVTYIPIVDNPL